MEEWSEIRRRVLVEGVSRRQVMRETGMRWRTLAKILGHSEPPGYRQAPMKASRCTTDKSEQGWKNLREALIGFMRLTP